MYCWILSIFSPPSFYFLSFNITGGNLFCLHVIVIFYGYVEKKSHHFFSYYPMNRREVQKRGSKTFELHVEETDGYGSSVNLFSFESKSSWLYNILEKPRSQAFPACLPGKYLWSHLRGHIYVNTYGGHIYVNTYGHIYVYMRRGVYVLCGWRQAGACRQHKARRHLSSYTIHAIYVAFPPRETASCLH